MTRGDRVCAFIETHCIVPSGILKGRLFELQPFQRDFVLSVYDNPEGTRRGILSIGRKNGKTALIACLVLAHLVGPEAVANGEIVSGALSRDQASLVYRQARDIAMASPTLRGRVHYTDSLKRLIGQKLATEYRAMAAEGKTAHGQSPVVAIIDEMGQETGPSNDFFSAIMTSQGAHANPLLLVISTQAATDGAMLSIMIDDALTNADPQIICHLHAAPSDAEMDDEDAWRAANPALGVFRSEADLRMQADEAMRQPSKENEFRNLILNQRVTLFRPFMAKSVWTENAGAPDDAAFDGRVFGGLDLSQTTDLTAFVLVARKDGAWHVRPHFWMARERMEDLARRDRAPYDVWARQGFLRLTTGKSIDYGELAADIMELTAGMDLGQIAFDRYRMPILEQHLGLLGVSLPLLAYGQGTASMSPALDATEIEFLHGRVRHGGHPVLGMCASNAVVNVNAAGDRKLDKAKSSGRIDGMVALVMAMGVATMEQVATSPSVYETRGVLVL